MTVDIKTHLAELMRAALTALAPDQRDTTIVLERPKQASHGDFSCNLAMQLARSMKRNPRELAQQLVSGIRRHCSSTASRSLARGSSISI